MKESARAIKFALFSISAGVIELAAFSLLDTVTGWDYWPCYLIALILSVLWNFTFNRRYTFRSDASIPSGQPATYPGPWPWWRDFTAYLPR